LRLWKLGSIPPGLTPDEASLGYNAFSILKTGRDEYGELLPLILKSFGDYKPGFYVYLTIPFVALFGLYEWSVRLPSALAGVVAVWLIYLIVGKLFPKYKLKIVNCELRILSAALLAISPWHIHFSRGAWEVNVSLTLTLAGILFFLKSLKISRFLLLSSLFFSLTLFTYQGAKLSTAIVAGLLVLIYRKGLLKIERLVLIKSFVFGLILALPIIVSLFAGKTGRLEVFSIFSYPRPQDYLQTFLDQGNEKVGDLKYYLYHPESINFTRGILGRWSNHFSGRFLIFRGDYQNPRHSAPNHGMLQLFDFLLLPLGLLAIARYGIKKNIKFILMWLVFAPLPAVLSRDQVQAVRALNMAIPLTLISSFGFLYTLSIMRKVYSRLLRTVLYSLLAGLFMASGLYFLDSYFVHLPKHNAKYWFYGYREVVKKVTPIQSRYNKIIFQQSYDQPYIYFLFYQKYDPVKYQEQAKLILSGVDVGLIGKLDNIYFENFTWPHATGQKDSLLIGNSIAIPSDFSIDSYELIAEIKYPDNFMTAFRIVETK
jgi:4-amino-4-deoxy-L-arabinose transferase-like glycosyltransferase